MKHENQAVRERLERAVMSGDKGAEAFLTFIDRMMSDYAIEGLEGANSFWADNPDHAVFEFKIRGKASASGKKFDTTILEYWQFRDGKLLSVLPCWFEVPD